MSAFYISLSGSEGSPFFIYAKEVTFIVGDLADMTIILGLFCIVLIMAVLSDWYDNGRF